MRSLACAGFLLALACAAVADDVTPARIVSLSPLATEIVHGLGEGSRLVPFPRAEPGAPVEAAPDLVIVPDAEMAAVERSLPATPRLRVDVHDFDELWALCHEIGAALGRSAEARRFVREVSRPLAEISAASFGKRRPRAVALTSLEPLVIAGGHGFAADWIEIGGGENVSHGREATSIPMSATDLRRAAPELALIVGPSLASAREVALARELVGPGVRIESLVIPAPGRWLEAAAPTARQVQGWIDAVRQRATSRKR